MQLVSHCLHKDEGIVRIVIKFHLILSEFIAIYWFLFALKFLVKGNFIKFTFIKPAHQTKAESLLIWICQYLHVSGRKFCG